MIILETVLLCLGILLAIFCLSLLIAEVTEQRKRKKKGGESMPLTWTSIDTTDWDMHQISREMERQRKNEMDLMKDRAVQKLKDLGYRWHDEDKGWVSLYNMDEI